MGKTAPDARSHSTPMTDERPPSRGDSEFAICESCMWTATAFRSNGGYRFLDECPVCSNENLSFIPLAKNEAYRFSIDHRNGLDIEFGTA